MGALQNGCLHVLWYMHDREARNLQDVETNENLVRSGKICLHYVRDGRVLHRDSPDGDFFLRDILAASNKQFVRTLSAKVTDAMRKKAQDGWLPYNHVPLGYMHQKVRDEFGRERKRGTIIVPDTNLQNVRLVRREFELRAQRLSYDAIRETTLRERLVDERRRKTYSRTGIEKRLKNQFYWGVVEWDGETYKGKHTLIIPQETLAKVKASFLTKGYNPRNQSKSFPSGWLKCADPSCSCYITYDPKTKPPLRGSTQKRVFEYFRCANGKRVHKTMKGLHFKEPEIWNMLKEPVRLITMTPSFGDEIMAEFQNVHAEFKRQKKEEMEGFREGLKQLEGAEDRLYDELRSGILDEPAYKRQLQRVRAERSRYVDLLDKATDDIYDAVLDIAERAITLCKDAESKYNSLSAPERVEMLKKLLSHPLLEGGENRKLKYCYNVEFAALAEARSAEARNEEWRPLVELFIIECFAWAA